MSRRCGGLQLAYVFFSSFSLCFSVLLKSVSLAGVCELRRVSELLLIHMCVCVFVWIRPLRMQSFFLLRTLLLQ